MTLPLPRRGTLRSGAAALVAALLLASCASGGVWRGAAGRAGSGDAMAGDLAARLERSTGVLLPLRILHPYDGAVVPRDIASIPVVWDASRADGWEWLVTVRFADGGMIASTAAGGTWTPPRALWEEIKERSLESPAEVTVTAFRSATKEPVARSAVRLSTSRDPVGAPIFYRLLVPSFAEGQRRPETIRWLLGDVSSYDPPRVVMKDLPVCGSCHSTSADGSLVGMDIDYRGDKGAYALFSPRPEVTLSEEDFITWNAYPRRDEIRTTALFSRISPDGRTVLSNVNEIMFLMKIPDPSCSQLFYPLRGVIARYDVETGAFASLPGADDPSFIQTVPAWSPDGRTVLFSRAPRLDAMIAELGAKTILDAPAGETIESLNRRYPVRFDVYSVPFNGGKGGAPVPLAGASKNGWSNYNARFSPDGRWVVLTRSRTGLVIQPDAELAILPASGGEARRMTCNRAGSNSWHSWSPNGRWIVFASKANTPCTELFLAHVDEAGGDAPPVLLTRLNAPSLAANVPEFFPGPAALLRSLRVVGAARGR